MNLTADWDVVWKEYRGVGGFWLSMIGLVVLLEALVVFSSSEPAWTRLMVYNLALAAPAFFALGCTGAAFAMEQEEGTFDFLRAAPVTPRQILWSKLGLATIATLSMFLVLWPSALLLSGCKFPESNEFHRILSLWLV